MSKPNIFKIKRIGSISAIAMAALLVMTPANAESNLEKDATPSVTSYQAEETQQETRDYWTKERMASAIPMEMPVGSSSADESAKSRSTKEPDSTIVTPPKMLSERALPTIDSKVIAKTQSAEQPNFSKTNGKVFFQKADNINYVCSGAVVNSPTKRTVITAGHCVHGGGPDGILHKYWNFKPAYDNGAPYFSYEGKSFHITNEWLEHGATNAGLAADVAFVHTYYNPFGKTLVDAVGGHGLEIGGDTTFDADIFGYPGRKVTPNPFDGEKQITCAGETKKEWLSLFHRALRLDGCPINGGGSGGPWLDLYDNSTGLGNVRSVSSYIPTNEDEDPYVVGPIFGPQVEELYLAANANP